MTIHSWLRERIMGRREAYRRTFLDPTGQTTLESEKVLRDLARFCYARKPGLKVTASGADALALGIAEGRREVWLRITEHLYLEDRYIVNLREEPSNDD